MKVSNCSIGPSDQSSWIFIRLAREMINRKDKLELKERVKKRKQRSDSEGEESKEGIGSQM